MPSVSGKQHRFFEMIAHNPQRARELKVPQSVGRDFIDADKASGKHFPAKTKRRRLVSAVMQRTRPG